MKIPQTISGINFRKVFKWTGYILTSFALLLTIFFFVLKANLDKIQTTIVAELNEQINGTVSMGEMNITLMNHFPHFSLIVNEILVTDLQFDEHQEQLFHAKKMYFQIRVFKLLQKKVEFRAITLIDAELNLIRSTDGSLNSKNIVKPKANGSASSSGGALLLSRIYLKNVHLIFEDKMWGKKYDLTFKDSFGKISYSDTTTVIHTNDRIEVAGLTFKPERGSCLTNKTLDTNLNIEWDKLDRTILIKQSSIEIDDNKLSMEGSFKTGIVPMLNLKLTSKGIPMDEAIKYLSHYTQEKLNGYNFEKPVPISLTIHGAVNPALPLEIDLNFKVKNNTFTTPTKTFEEVSLNGHYYNHLNDLVLNDEKNSAVSFTSFTGKYEGIPFKMDLFAKDLSAPVLTTNIKCDIQLTDLNAAVDTAMILFSGGTLNLDATFRGSLKGAKNVDADSMDALIYGSAKIQNAACRFPLKKYNVQNIQGDIEFEGKAMNIKSLAFSLNNNPVNISATISQFVNALLVPEVKLIADAEVTCSRFNLDNFEKPVEVNAMPMKRKKIAGIVNSVLSNLEGNINLRINQLTYKKLTIENSRGHVTIGNGYISCRDVSMQIADGNFTLNGKLAGIGRASSSVNFSTTVANADIQQLFYQMDNFNQNAITSSNLRGSLNAKVQFQASLTKSFTISPSSMYGSFEIQIADGELLNMDALNQITKNIFKKKDFSDIQFAELINKSTLKANKFHIEQMEIQSNVLTMYVHGVYSFGDSTELFIRVPVKSLKVQEDDYIAENREVDEKIGLSINLKATKQDGKLKISPVLFRKNVK